MRQEIVMPRLTEAVEEGVVVTWFVAPGAQIRTGDLVAEIQVEKSSAEVRASIDGRLVELLIEPGGIVAQGAPIAMIETEPVAAPGVVPAPPGGPASPAARRLARELGVDLAAVSGSGPDGRIIETDVRAAAERRAGARPAGPAPGRIEPLSPIRRTIADRLRLGLAATAQLTLTAEADVSALADELARLSEEAGRRISYTEATVRACALALREHPRLGAQLSGSSLVYPDRIDVGVAVSLDEGLIVPVVRSADQSDLTALSVEIARLAERARSGAIEPAETEGACFGVTSLGAHRIDAFTPLLNPPQTAILGIGRARPKPAIVEGQIVARVLVVLSLTFDHQVVDGAPAAAFLGTVVDLLEHPERLVAPLTASGAPGPE